MRIVLLFGLVVTAGAVHAAAALAGQFSNELDASDYDCILILEPSMSLSEKSAVRLTLEWDKGKPFARVTITRDRLTVEATHSGGSKVIAQMNPEVVPGMPYNLTILRRGVLMGLLHGDTFLGRGDLPRGNGTKAAITADAGWTVKESRIQRLEPVVFSDDFMRVDGENSPWSKVSGNWRLKTAWDDIPHGIFIDSGNAATTKSAYETPDKAQNPFSWIGGGNGNQPGIATTGNAYWEDYTFSVAVNPGRESVCGVLINNAYTGKDNLYTALLLRWTPANSTRTGGNKLALYSYKYTYNEKPRAAGGFSMTELASSPGGFIPGQWYKLSVVTSLEGVRVSVDGRERITQKSVTPWRGSVGLYAEGATGTMFDDVTVYGRTLNTDLLYETKQLHLAQKFLTDTTGGMQYWSIRPDNWILDGAVSNFRWFSQELYGDHCWVAMTVAPATSANGEFWMTLNADGTNARSGYRAVLQTGGSPAKLTYSLYRNDAVLIKKSVAPLAAGTDYSLRFWRIENSISLEVDGDTVISATDPNPLTGCRAGYRNEGGMFSKVTEVQVLGHNTLDYPFSDAPTDWLTEGTWEPSIRWSCNPYWSFLAGWSRGNAVLWQKRSLRGDQSIEAYVGSKMDYPRETDTYYNRQGYFSVTLCGDGQDPRTGYAGIYGYPDDNGNPLALAVILRDGKVVARTPVTRRSWAANHRSWFRLQIRKVGNTIDFKAKIDNEVYTLSFTDENPITEGVPAVWTYNSAMTVARVRLDFANPPVPRNDPRIVIPTPWYPEWVNQGMPMTLDLSDSWSTTGKSIAWKVTPAEVPAGDEKAVQVSDGKLRFTPQRPGKHWYRVTAVDGPVKSSDFHLSLAVFNPALKRDDSHALVLYRFDEGKGNIVHDRGVAEPKLDLTIPPDTNGLFKWLPGQGVELRGAKAMKSGIPADKLLKIKETKACTLEVWQSASTMFGPYRRSGCFFTWEPTPPVDGIKPDKNMLAEGIPNLAYYFTQDYVSVATGDLAIQANSKPIWFIGMQTSFHHLVITWDGNTTTCYMDGVQLSDEKTLPWNVDKWVKGAPLFVGNQTNDFRGYPGSLYLLAIHDRCFTAADVKRQYNAGPSAR